MQTVNFASRAIAPSCDIDWVLIVLFLASAPIQHADQTSFFRELIIKCARAAVWSIAPITTFHISLSIFSPSFQSTKKQYLLYKANTIRINLKC